MRLVRGAGRKEGWMKERGGGCDSGVPPRRLTLETGAVRMHAEMKIKYSAPSRHLMLPTSEGRRRQSQKRRTRTKSRTERRRLEDAGEFGNCHGTGTVEQNLKYHRVPRTCVSGVRSPHLPSSQVCWGVYIDDSITWKVRYIRSSFLHAF